MFKFFVYFKFIHLSENLLESVVYKNQQDLATVLSHLERSFHSMLTNNLTKDASEFVSALKTWDMIVRFARAHNAPLPSFFLRFLASHDSWIEFILVGQIFSYPSDQVDEIKYVIKNSIFLFCVKLITNSFQMLDIIRLFENFNIREHLLLSLNNPHLLSSNSSVETLEVKSQDSRQSLYFKIGVKRNVSRSLN